MLDYKNIIQKIMSEQETKFIRKLWITLISTIGPLVIMIIFNAGITLQRVSANEKHIDAIQNDYATREVLLLYYNELRELNTAVQKSVDNHCVETEKEVDRINTKMDNIIKDVYEVKKRGVVNGN